MYIIKTIVLFLQVVKFSILKIFCKTKETGNNNCSNNRNNKLKSTKRKFNQIGFEVPLKFFEDFMNMEKLNKKEINKLKNEMSKMEYIGRKGNDKGKKCTYKKSSIDTFITGTYKMFKNKEQWEYLNKIIKSKNKKEITYEKKYRAATLLFKYRKQYFESIYTK